ncbi:hypothetical protein WK32_16595 [Burkholderia vietnamiensis]|nr:hypothetical protein WK32_16595 [Burkholderia vietnamiensis]
MRKDRMVALSAVCGLASLGGLAYAYRLDWNVPTATLVTCGVALALSFCGLISAVALGSSGE